MGGPPESMPEPGVTAVGGSRGYRLEEPQGAGGLPVERRTADMEVLVTVGTTSFDRLLAAVTRAAVLTVLKKWGYGHLTLQIGNSDFNLDSDTIEEVRIDYYRFKPSLSDDIQKADLIISHAGAGSCLEALEAEKKLLVVVNDELMHNHQIELAEKLSEEGFCYYTVCSNLQQTLETADFSKLKTYPKGNNKVFTHYIDELMGFR